MAGIEDIETQLQTALAQLSSVMEVLQEAHEVAKQEGTAFLQVLPDGTVTLLDNKQIQITIAGE